MLFLSKYNYFFLPVGSIITILSANMLGQHFATSFFKMSAKYALTEFLIHTEVKPSAILARINCNMGYIFTKCFPQVHILTF